MKTLIKSLAILATLVGFAQAAGTANTAISLPTIGGKTIHITGTDNGLNIPEYKGKVVFLEFWGTHCPPCLASIPHYVDLISKHKDKLAMLGIEVQDTPKDQLKTFAAAKGINYDVVAYRDAGPFVEYIARRAGWKGSIPFLLILDQQGNVVTMQVGMLPEAALEKVFNDLINKKIQPKATPKATPKSATQKAKPAA
jgi:thiol-disulfide isomerase/thioredoxin